MLECDDKKFISLNSKTYEYFIQVVVDVHTGVNYLYQKDTGLCPRYNTDGTLMVTPAHELTELVNQATEKENRRV